MVVKRGEMRETLGPPDRPAARQGARAGRGVSTSRPYDPMSHRIEPIIDRLHSLHPRLIDLSLDRLAPLLAQLGHPERRLPPVIHVAGTNGKGSTCAFLRAMAEAAGLARARLHLAAPGALQRAHPHRRRARLRRGRWPRRWRTIERVNAGAPITVFEVITAAAFQLFAAMPADLCVLEVGLGGRGDATNVIDRPAACAITSISLDHREMLGDTLGGDRRGEGRDHEAGRARGDRGAAAEVAARSCDDAAARVGATLRAARPRLDDRADATGLRYHRCGGALELPPPVAARPAPARQRRRSPSPRCAPRCSVADAAYAGLARAEWPARMQRLHGRLAATAAAGLGAVAGWRPQSRRRRSRWRKPARLGGPARPPHRRHEAGQGFRRNSSRPLLPLAATRLGRARSRASIWRCRSRRSSRRPAAWPGPARPWRTRCAPLPHGGRPPAC